MPYTGSRKEAERRRLRAMTLLDKGLAQSRVAAKLGVTPSAVSKWVKEVVPKSWTASQPA